MLRAEVRVAGTPVSRIEHGLVVLVGVGQGDVEEEARALARKVADLRIFRDDAGKTNRSLLDVGGDVLAVSQFTLFADVRRGRRPSFIEAAGPELADRLYQIFATALEELGVRVRRGVFGAEMEVELVNDGPMTIWVDGSSSPASR